MTEQIRQVRDAKGGERTVKVKRVGPSVAEAPPLLIAIGGYLSEHLDGPIAEWRCWVRFAGGEVDSVIVGADFIDVFRERERFLRNTRVRYVEPIRAVVADSATRSGWREVSPDPESVVHHDDLFAGRLEMRLSAKRKRIEQECGYPVHWLDRMD